MTNKPKKLTTTTTIDEAFRKGLDDRDFGRGPPVAPDPETAEEEHWELYEAKREAYDSRSDLDEEGEYVGNE